MATLKELHELSPGRKINVRFGDKRPKFLMYLGRIHVFEKDQLEFEFMGQDGVDIHIQDLYEDTHIICKPIDVEILPEREIMYV